MPLILPGNVASATTAVGFSVANSCRFNRGDSPLLSKTQSTSPTHDDKCTMSFWFKLGSQAATASRGFSFGSGDDASNRWHFYIETDGQFYYYGKLGGSVNMTINSTPMYRDPSAWYHYCLAIDTTQGTAANRVRTYINNVEITDYETATYPSQNDNCPLVKGADMQIGAIRGGSYQNYNYADCYMAEVCFIDGQQLTPSSFGEYDEDSPTIWKPIDVSGLTFGTNGYYLDFEDSANLGNDANGGTDFTETNLAAVDQATDTPTNSFCTISPLDGGAGTYTFSEGNCQIQGTSTSWYARGSTFAVTKGKWYWEVEFDAGTMIEIMVGIHDTSHNRTGSGSANWSTGSTLFYNDSGGELRIDGTDTTNNYGTLTAGDILGIALNMDDKQITVYDNGSAIASNVAISSSITEAMPTFLTDATNVVFKANFGGCPAFTVSSANADGNGYGNFEYAVPSGYYALCTKNLAEFG